MIAFDNGPARGDYVRYIDDLMERAAATVAAAPVPGMDVDPEPMRRMRERIADRSGDGAAARGARGPDAVRPERRPDGLRAPAVGTTATAASTGFVDPTPASNAAARAAAIAAALMSGEIARRSSPARGTTVSLGAIVLGLLAIVVGIVWPAVSLGLFIVGGAAMAWGGRRLRDAARTPLVVPASSGSSGR